ncbi:MAG: cysteine--tRNA ligase [Phycisphaerales bacterium]
MPSSLHLFNTYSRRIEQFRASDPANVTFYTCGPTVYDDAHIGNFRSFLAADVLRRWIESPLCVVANLTGSEHRSASGRTVTHVMNITDVGHMTDDAEGGESGEDRMAVAGKRIAEAKKSGKLPQGTSIDPSDPYQIARFYEDRFKEDARQLGLKLALQAEKDKTLMPRATENVAGMIEVVRKLIETNCAYVVGSPGSRVVYFSVQSFPTYGQLSGNTLDALREGEGGRISASNQSQKKHPADFLLWKEDPSHIMKWDSPWGKGYPGWHIECTVMSLGRLSASGHGANGVSGSPLIDLHSGGEDNIFPHHECEIAQSCCAYSGGKGSFAAMWFHPRFLLVEGTKMSKSKGNFFTARDLFAKGVEPAAVRLELIKTHYRSNANFTMQGLTDSQRMIDRWRRFEDAAKANSSTSTNASQAAVQERAREDFAASLHDDLNIAGAIAAVNTYVGAVESPNASDLGVLKLFDDVLGVLSLHRPQSAATEIGVWAPGLTPDPAVEALLMQRRDARAAKDFKASDVIRDTLASMGFAIKDMAGGKVEVRRTS